MKRNRKNKKDLTLKDPSNIYTDISSFIKNAETDIDKVYTKRELEISLNNKQKRFCIEYNTDFNGTRSYMKAYGLKGGVDSEQYNVASAAASRLLRNVKIIQYIAHTKGRYEENLGISKQRQIREYEKIAYSSLQKYHMTWIELKDFDELKENDPDALDALESIETKTEKRINDCKEMIEVEYIKIKCHSKLKALERIDKLNGYETPEKVDIDVKETIDVKTLSKTAQAALLELARNQNK